MAIGEVAGLVFFVARPLASYTGFPYIGGVQKTNKKDKVKMDNKTITIGDFITIPAWRTTGLVIDTEATLIGSETAQRVLVQDRPEAAGRWYTLELDQFEIEGAN